MAEDEQEQVHAAKIHTITGNRKSGRCFPQLDAKAHNCKVTIAWLNSELETVAGQAPEDMDIQLLRACTFSHHMFWVSMDRCGRYLTEEEANTIVTHGYNFWETYSALAQRAASRGGHTSILYQRFIILVIPLTK